LRSDGTFYAFGTVYEVSEAKHRDEKAKTVQREVLYYIRQVAVGKHVTFLHYHQKTSYNASCG